MKKKAFYLVVAIVVCLMTFNYLEGSFENGNNSELNETERLMLYEQYEEETNAAIAFHQISNQQEYVAYMSDFEEWLDKKGE